MKALQLLAVVALSLPTFVSGVPFAEADLEVREAEPAEATSICLKETELSRCPFGKIGCRCPCRPIYCPKGQEQYWDPIKKKCSCRPPVFPCAAVLCPFNTKLVYDEVKKECRCEPIKPPCELILCAPNDPQCGCDPTHP